MQSIGKGRWREESDVWMEELGEGVRSQMFKLGLLFDHSYIFFFLQASTEHLQCTKFFLSIILSLWLLHFLTSYLLPPLETQSGLSMFWAELISILY